MLWKDLPRGFDYIIYNFMKKTDRMSDFVVDTDHTERFRIRVVPPQRARLAACLVLIFDGHVSQSFQRSTMIDVFIAN